MFSDVPSWVFFKDFGCKCENFFLKRISWWLLLRKSWKQLSYWMFLIRSFQRKYKIKDYLLITSIVSVFATLALTQDSNLSIQIFVDNISSSFNIMEQSWKELVESYYDRGKSFFTKVPQVINVLFRKDHVYKTLYYKWQKTRIINIWNKSHHMLLVDFRKLIHLMQTNEFPCLQKFYKWECFPILKQCT